MVDHCGGRLLLLPDEPADRASTLLGFRVPDRRWRFESDLETDAPGLALRLRLDDSHWCEVMASAGEATAAMRIGPLETPVGAVVALGQASVTLGIEAVDSATDGPDDLLLYVVRDGIRSEIARADGRYLSTEVAGGFTGRVVGVRAIAEPVAVRSVRYVSVLRASSVTGD